MAGLCRPKLRGGSRRGCPLSCAASGVSLLNISARIIGSIHPRVQHRHFHFSRIVVLVMPTSLCSKCAGIKLDDLLTKEAKALLWARAARELSISAASCELCAVLVAECRPAELENGDGILRLRSSRDKEGTIALHGMKKKLILVGAEMQEAEWEDPTPMATAQLHYEGGPYT